MVLHSVVMKLQSEGVLPGGVWNNQRERFCRPLKIRNKSLKVFLFPEGLLRTVVFSDIWQTPISYGGACGRCRKERWGSVKRAHALVGVDGFMTVLDPDKAASETPRNAQKHCPESFQVESTFPGARVQHNLSFSVSLGTQQMTPFCNLPTILKYVQMSMRSHLTHSAAAGSTPTNEIEIHRWWVGHTAPLMTLSRKMFPIWQTIMTKNIM